MSKTSGVTENAARGLNLLVPGFLKRNYLCLPLTNPEQGTNKPPRHTALGDPTEIGSSVTIFQGRNVSRTWTNRTRIP
ncbi:hypothetical protein M5689_006204 [Euphorbia peplus]|nr:hypothetical protein M5689_006204 [Euphorbia peplus]